MHKISVSPQALKQAAVTVDTAQFNADVNSVLKGVERRLEDFINMAKHSPTKASAVSITYEDHTKRVPVLTAACRILVDQGFNATVGHDEGYDDGPCSVHNSPPRDYIVIVP